MARLQAGSDTKTFVVPSLPMRETPPVLPPPTEATLHEAALAYLARYAASRAGLIRVLDRRLARWARTTPDVPAETLAECRAAVRRVADRLVQSGVIDDAAFAESRARSLTRAGRSRRAVAAHLGARGIAQEAVAAVLAEETDTELTACLILTRKRRIGAFRSADKAEDRRRELGVLARAGYAQSVAEAALDMSQDEAEDRINRLRQG
jgi:regulatory protein